MVEFSISDILNYAECPSKLKYPENTKLFDTRESVTAYLVSNLFTYLFLESQKNKVKDVPDLNKQLNILWSKIKDRVLFNYRPSDMVIFQSYSKRVLTHFYNHNKIEVLGVGQIFDYVVGEDTITIPLSIFRSVTSVHLYYIDSNLSSADLPVGYSFLSPMVHRIGKELCKGHTYSTRPVIYRSQSLRSYQCIDNTRVDEALENIVSALKNKLYYPLIGPTCKLCKNKESCKWYDKPTTN